MNILIQRFSGRIKWIKTYTVWFIYTIQLKRFDSVKWFVIKWALILSTINLGVIVVARFISKFTALTRNAFGLWDEDVGQKSTLFFWHKVRDSRRVLEAACWRVQQEVSLLQHFHFYHWTRSLNPESFTFSYKTVLNEAAKQPYKQISGCWTSVSLVVSMVTKKQRAVCLMSFWCYMLKPLQFQCLLTSSRFSLIYIL